MIVIDDPRTWPPELLEALSDPSITQEVQRCRYLEDLPRSGALRNALDLARKVIEDRGIVAFHCAKEPIPGRFIEQGLRVLDLEAHQRELLDLLRGDLTSVQFERARVRLAEFAASNQRAIREGRIWFAFTRYVAVDPGAEKFFRFVGGEGLYWWLWRDPEIGPVLAAKGEPVVVEVMLWPREMRPESMYGQWGLGESLVSHHARRLNPRFYPHDVETYICEPIVPERIVAVHRLDEFRSRLEPLAVHWEEDE